MSSVLYTKSCHADFGLMTTAIKHPVVLLDGIHCPGQADRPPPEKIASNTKALAPLREGGSHLGTADQARTAMQVASAALRIRAPLSAAGHLFNSGSHPPCHFCPRLVLNQAIPIGVFWPCAGRTENRPIEPDAVRTDVGNSETPF